MDRVSTLLVVVAVLAGLSACKETKVKDKPETLRSLADCEKAKADKDDYIKELEKRVADFELKGADGDVVVNLEGDGLTIAAVSGKGPYTRERVEKGNAKDKELYEGFLRAVKRSRGSLKRCYQNALKKNSALQARSIPMAIQVRYRTDGKVAGAQFSPRVSSDFDRCMQSVSKGWTLPKMPRPVTFNSKITLTPQ